MTQNLKINYTSDEIFTISSGKKEIAWVQWSKTYRIWRVLMLTDHRIHHLKTEKEILNLCSDEVDII